MWSETVWMAEKTYKGCAIVMAVEEQTSADTLLVERCFEGKMVDKITIDMPIAHLPRQTSKSFFSILFLTICLSPEEK